MRLPTTLGSTSCLALVIILISFNPLTSGHKGHDHGDEDHSNDVEDSIPETDTEWSDPAVHTLPFNGLTLKWKQDPKDSKYVVMKMSGRTSGYVAVGFCVIWTGGMENCDIVLGWVDSSGVANVHDYYAVGNTSPLLDKKQSCQLISGKEANGITNIVFKRMWDTGDDEHDANLEHNQNVHVIYAWHAMDPISPSDFRKHEDGDRGHTMRAVSIKGHMHGSAERLFGSVSITSMCTIAWYFLRF